MEICQNQGNMEEEQKEPDKPKTISSYHKGVIILFFLAFVVLKIIDWVT